jgi:SnoaL-like domain
MAEPHPFRRAAEAKDVELMTDALREDVELHSPVLFRGFEGRETVIGVITHVAATLEDFAYTDEAVGDGTVVLRFKARVGDLELEGIDHLTLDEEGKVADLTVFMRPMKALTAFNAQMAERLGVELPSN